MNKIGKTFGLLTVKKKASNVFVGGQSRSAYLCVCRCGKEVIRLSQNLNNNFKSNCGCWSKQQVTKLGKTKGKKRFWNYKHGMFGTRFYSIYNNLVYRCSNPKSISFRFYGAIGIKNKFNSFNHFYDTMYASYIKHIKKYGIKQTTIDRIDSTKNYSPNNCRWASYKEQANNRKDNMVLSYKGKTQTLAQWCKDFNLSAYLTLKKIRT